MIKYLLSFLIFVSFVFSANAQNGRISLSTSYNMPLGKMKWSYKSAPDIQLAALREFDNSKRWNTGFGLAIGYTKFNPIADTLYYVADRGGVGGLGLGKAVYSPFTIFKFSASLMAIRKFNKKVGAELGLDVGYYYGKRDIDFTDEFGGQDGLSEFVTRGALVPRLGLSYNLNNQWNVTPFVSYTFMLEIGNTDPAAMNYNPDTGAWLSYYSAGLALNYLF